MCVRHVFLHLVVGPIWLGGQRRDEAPGRHGQSTQPDPGVSYGTLGKEW
jgi:hypothetical protein